MAETTFVPQSPYQAFLQSPGGIANTRLTLVSGQPVMTSSVLAATQVFITPYFGTRIPFFNPAESVWRYENFSEQLIQLTLGTGTQQVTTASNYDVYAWLSGGQPTFSLSAAWSSDTVIGVVPGGAERTSMAGMFLNRWNITGGPPAMRGTLLGTIRTGTSAAVDFNFGGQASSTAWSTATFNVSNYFNARELTTFLSNSSGATVLQSATGASTQPMGGQASARINFLRCVDEEPVKAQNKSFVSITPASGIYSIGFGLDQTTSMAASSQIGIAIPAAVAATSVNWSVSGEYVGLPGMGFHFLSPNERAQVGTTAVNGWSVTNPTGVMFSGKF